MGRLAKYPAALRPSIPAVLTLAGGQSSGDVFHTLLYAVCQSQSEFDEMVALDATLLQLIRFDRCDDIFRQLFEDRSLAGCYYVDGGSYLTFGKQISCVLFSK
jgi:hypothetical protein